MIDDTQIDYKSLHGPDRVRAYNRLRYHKKKLEQGIIPKRPNACAKLKADIDKLKSKTIENEVKELLQSRNENYAQVMRDRLLKLEPKLDQILDMLSDEHGKALMDQLKIKAHQMILDEYTE